MPIGPRIAVIGAGNRLAALPVLSTIFNLPPDAGDLITLYDPHEEMLDLFGRLARAFNAFNGTPGVFVATTQDLEEALDGADSVIISLAEIHSDRLAEVSGLLRNDGSQLVFNMMSPTQSSGAKLNCSAFHLDWPEHVPVDEQYVFAHRALRLVRGDEPIFEPLQQYKENPLATAMLDSRPAPENRYDPEDSTKRAY